MEGIGPGLKPTPPSASKASPSTVEFTTVNQPYTLAANGVAMQYHDPRGDKLTPPQKSWLTNHLNEFETVLYGANWRDPSLGYLKYIDPDSFVDQHWIVEFPKNIDGYRLSDYMHKDRGGKIKMEPIWDWNLSFGNANYLEGVLTNNWYFPQLGGGDDIWLSRLRTDPDFYQRIIDRWGNCARMCSRCPICWGASTPSPTCSGRRRRGTSRAGRA